MTAFVNPLYNDFHFVQLSVLELFDRILHDDTIKFKKSFDELRNFIAFGVLPGKFIHDICALSRSNATLGFLSNIKSNPMWLTEALFWKTSSDLDDLMIGI